MSIETLSVGGISCDKEVARSVTPSGQSLLINPVGTDSVLIVRPLRKEFSGFPYDKELDRRREAVDWHRNNLLEYTLKTDLVVLEGAPNGSNGESVPLFGRLTPRLTNVWPVSEMPAAEIVGDGELCLALAEINFAYFWEFLRSGASFDLGSKGLNDGFLPSPALWLVSYMVSNNVMVGECPGGERRVFCDPDWFIRMSDIETGSLLWNMRIKAVLAKRTSLCLARAAFFFTVFLANKTGEKKKSLSDKLEIVFRLARN